MFGVWSCVYAYTRGILIPIPLYSFPFHYPHSHSIILISIVRMCILQISDQATQASVPTRIGRPAHQLWSLSIPYTGICSG